MKLSDMQGILAKIREDLLLAVAAVEAAKKLEAELAVKVGPLIQLEMLVRARQRWMPAHKLAALRKEIGFLRQRQEDERKYRQAREERVAELRRQEADFAVRKP